jgi:hypothetical protein
MTVHCSPQPTRRGPPIGSVRERQAGLPEPLRALHRRLLAGFLTYAGPPEPAAVAALAAEPGGEPPSEISLACRLYRLEHRFAGQPAEQWVRDALLAAGRAGATPAASNSPPPTGAEPIGGGHG